MKRWVSAQARSMMSIRSPISPWAHPFISRSPGPSLPWAVAFHHKKMVGGECKTHHPSNIAAEERIIGF